MVDLLINNQELKRLIHERMTEMGLGIDDVTKDINLKKKDVSAWLIGSKTENISHDVIVELANNLGLEVRLTLIKHDLRKSIYGRK